MHCEDLCEFVTSVSSSLDFPDVSTTMPINWIKVTRSIFYFVSDLENDIGHVTEHEVLHLFFGHLGTENDARSSKILIFLKFRKYR